MANFNSIDPLKNFNVTPLAAPKMSDAYAKALNGAVTDPAENQRILRQAERTTLPGMKVPANGGGTLGASLKAIKQIGNVKAKKGLV